MERKININKKKLIYICEHYLPLTMLNKVVQFRMTINKLNIFAYDFLSDTSTLLLTICLHATVWGDYLSRDV